MKNLNEAIIEILNGEWAHPEQSCFDAFWQGYDSLQDELYEQHGIKTDMKTLRKAMKQLATEGKVELKPTYDEDFRICGRGWFIKK